MIMGMIDSDDHDDDDGDDHNAILSRILVYSNIETCTICNVIFQYLHFLIIPIFDEVELQISEQIDIHLLLFTFCFPHLQHCTPVKVAVQKRSHGKSKTNDFTFKLKVVVQQQPRGSYTLEVFKGFLAVGGQLEMMIKIKMTMTMLMMMTMTMTILIMVKLFR